MLQKNQQLARQFQQLHDSAKFLLCAGSDESLTVNEVKVKFGIKSCLIGFVREFVIITMVSLYEMAKDNKPNFAELEDAIDFNAICVGHGFSRADNSSITDNSGDESEEEAVFRHLRNAFCHGRFEIKSDGKNRVDLKMQDFNKKGEEKFCACCEMQVIINLSSRLLAKALKIKDEEFLKQLLDCGLFFTQCGLPANANKTIKDIRRKNNIGDLSKGFIVSFAIAAIIYSYEVAKSNKPNFVAIRDKIDPKKLGLSIPYAYRKHKQNSKISDSGGKEDDKEAVFRHLRNAFGHRNFVFDYKQGNVTIKDYDKSGVQTFETTCKMEEIIDLAEKLLIKGHKLMVN